MINNKRIMSRSSAKVCTYTATTATTTSTTVVQGVYEEVCRNKEITYKINCNKCITTFMIEM